MKLSEYKKPTRQKEIFDFSKLEHETFQFLCESEAEAIDFIVKYEAAFPKARAEHWKGSTYYKQNWYNRVYYKANRCGIFFRFDTDGKHLDCPLIKWSDYYEAE